MLESIESRLQIKMSAFQVVTHATRSWIGTDPGRTYRGSGGGQTGARQPGSGSAAMSSAVIGR
jgi:hypothetical protein